MTEPTETPGELFAQACAKREIFAFDTARDLLTQAVVRAPDFMAGWSKLALVLCDLGDFPGALSAAKRAVALDATVAETHLAVGIAMIGLDQKPIAGAALRRALTLDPNLAGAHDWLGCLRQVENDMDGALACYRRALSLDPALATAWYRLGTVLHHREDIDGAIEAFHKAVALRPDYDAAWNALGVTLGSLGRFEEAADCFHRALEINPRSGAALRNLSNFGGSADPVNSLAAVARVADDESHPLDERIPAAFGAGKWLDEAGRYDEAFDRFAQANALARRQELAAGASFDHAVLRREIDGMASVFTPAFFATRRDWGDPSELPVFIVGLFRSGTTLVEQIAASHALVHGAGELPEIRQITASILPVPARARDWPRALIERLAGEHLALLEAKQAGALRVIDKNPDNIFSLGLIATLFPRARIIFCRRDPRDSAFSCFVQAFTKGQTFASDLADCARRWVETERLAKIWRACLPNPMIEIQYETLVGDLEGESRRLIDFLGLDWDPACLKFHETERAVRTASSWQVRQPLYTSSIGRWRHYARHLGPMLDVFRENGIVLD